MPELRYFTAGESHGPGQFAFIEGIPYGAPFDAAAVDAELARRQGGYGRGARMKIEHDRVQVAGGVRHGRAIGGPVVLHIPNRVANIEELGPIHRVRPGHADLAGALKFGVADARDVSERASARETAARVAAGAWAAAYLAEFRIRVLGFVIRIGDCAVRRVPDDPDELARLRDASAFYSPDPEADEEFRRMVDAARADGDTLGGVVEVRAWGVPPGLGTFASFAEKLDGRLALALMSVQTVKGVEIGAGFAGSALRGSQFHGRVARTETGGLVRLSNSAGGIEGGMTNGMPLVLRAACKPISTLRKPLETVNLETGEAAQAQYERSDVCVVPAASVIAQAVVAFEIARAFLEKFGADTHEEVRERHARYLQRVADLTRAP
jgi:chorismate synthase